MCVHNRRLYLCVPCKGGGICEHEKRRSSCNLCGGSQLCEHNIVLYYCIPCNGGGICEHERRRSQCKLCGGSSICEHNIQKSTCKLCEGSQICKHEKNRNRCKICGDQIHITILNWIHTSKQDDKKNNRYDETNYIDYEFCKELIQESGKTCYYCDIELQYIEYNSILATIERLDNNIGHIKENCVIACRTCNVSKVGDRT
jgi:hypothetical protein